MRSSSTSVAVRGRTLRLPHLSIALVLALVLVVIAGIAPSVLSADEIPELEQYANRVDSALGLMEESSRYISAEQAKEIALQIDTLLPASEEIETPNGTVHVDNSILRSLTTRLASTDAPAERKRVYFELKVHLRSMALALEGDPSSVPEDPALLEKAVRDHYVPQRSLLAESLGEIIDRLLEALQHWWDGMGMSPKTSTVMTFVTVGIAVTLLLLLLLLLVRAVIHASRARAQREVRSVTKTVPEPSGDVSAEDSSDPLAAADALAAEGRLADAVRVLLKGATRALVRAGLVTSTRFRTNGELTRAVAGVPEVMEPLRGLVGIFDRVYYGHKELDEQEYAAARDFYERTVSTAHHRHEGVGGGPA